MPSRLTPSTLWIALLALLLGAGPCARRTEAEETPGVRPAAPNPAARPELSVERIFGGAPYHGALPAWRWRPGHPQLVRLEERDNLRRLLVLDPVTGAESTLLDLGELDALVPEPEHGTGERGLGRGGPERLLWTRDGRALCVLVRGERVWVNLEDGTRRRLTQAGPRRSDAQLSPGGRYLSYEAGNDLHLVPTGGGSPRVIAGTHPEVLHGTLDWVYPEELGSDHASWWSPDERSVAVLSLDQRPVPRYPIPDALALDGRAQTQRYPRAGDPNPRATLAVHRVEGSGAASKTTLALEQPAHEYVVRVTWTPDGQRVLVVTLDRAQQHVAVRAFDPLTGQGSLVLEERDAAWIEPPPAPRFVDERGFLWRDARGVWSLRALVPSAARASDAVRTLTPAAFVAGDVLHLLPAEPNCLVEGCLPGARGRTLWRSQGDQPPLPWVGASPGSPSVPRDGGSNESWDVGLDDAGTLALVRRSGTLTPPVLEVRRVRDGELVRSLGDSSTEEFRALELPDVERGQTPTEGGQVLWRLWKPRRLDPGRRMPLVVLVYGGPGSRTVEERFGSGPYWPALLVQRGFLVLQADGRGTGGQGSAFERAVRGRLGLLELADQVLAVQDVARRPDVDSTRVGIFGWSFGGTLAANALLRRSDVFRAGVAVASVTDWRLYDTIYTERYMGLPQENEAGYAATCAIEQAANLSGSLLLLHGLSDDNVHPQNTLRLVEALLAAKKSNFEWLLYPNRGHGLSGAGPDVFGRALTWFERHLRAP